MIDLTITTSDVLMHPIEPRHLKRREFLTPVEDEPNCYLLVLDNTAAEKIVRCPTAGYDFLILGREPYAKNAALTFGGAIHNGVECYLRGGKVDECNQEILKYFSENPTPPDEYRTPQNALQVFYHYIEQCRIREDYKELIFCDPTDPFIERAFELPLGVLEINQYVPGFGYIEKIYVAWAGRIDRVTRPVVMPRDHVVDLKTTSIKGDQFIQSFQLSNQTIGYVWAAQQMGLPEVRDFCLDAIFFKKPTGRNGLMEKGPRGGEQPLDFFRAYFSYSQQRIDAWAGNMLTIVEDFVHSFVRNFYPMHTFHCFNKYGKCPYHDACTIDDIEVRERVLKSDIYKEVTWDPTIK